MGLCKYKNMFGRPHAGLRKYRIFNIAILDTAVVILIGLAISYYFNFPLHWTLGALFLVGIIAHRIFCVRTGVDRMLFPNG